ncbi:MAG: hypothetical protein JW703_01195 [Candidatus Diapherotrites archaeon]|nr:hypothetical protein [Candidatus Diapherotrites archaeon]
MPLDSIISAARSRNVPRVQTAALQRASQNSAGTTKESIGSIASRVVNESLQRKEETRFIIGDTPIANSWNECKYLKEENGKHYCKKCFSWCAKEKCPPKMKI